MQVNGAATSDLDRLVQDLVERGQRQNELQQSDFLSLMIAQLQNQDPLKPLNDQEFISQVTQFNILDQVTAFNESLQAMQAFQATSLIGKHVEGFTELGAFVDGTVVEVILTNNTADLVLDGGQILKLKDVIRVLPDATPPSDAESPAPRA